MTKAQDIAGGVGLMATDGRTLAEWQEFARRDDCLERMVPSDLRQLLGVIERNTRAAPSVGAGEPDALDAEVERVLGMSENELREELGREGRSPEQELAAVDATVAKAMARLTLRSNKMPWASAEVYRGTSVVNGGVMLLDDRGACIGQVSVLNAEKRDEMISAVHTALTAALSPSPAHTGNEGLVKALERARKQLGGVTCDVMDGDNLAINLCTLYDNGEEAEDDTGWSQAARDGCDAVLNAIHAHYAAALIAPQGNDGWPDISTCPKGDTDLFLAGGFDRKGKFHAEVCCGRYVREELARKASGLYEDAPHLDRPLTHWTPMRDFPSSPSKED